MPQPPCASSPAPRQTRAPPPPRSRLLLYVAIDQACGRQQQLYNTRQAGRVILINSFGYMLTCCNDSSFVTCFL